MSLQSLQLAQKFFETYLHSGVQLHTPYTIILSPMNYLRKDQIRDALLEQLYIHPEMSLFQLNYRMAYGNATEQISLPECTINVAMEITKVHGDIPRRASIEGTFRFSTHYIASEPIVYEHSFDAYRGVDGTYSKFKYTQQAFVGMFRNRLMLAIPKFL